MYCQSAVAKTGPEKFLRTLCLFWRWSQIIDFSASRILRWWLHFPLLYELELDDFIREHRCPHRLLVAVRLASSAFAGLGPRTLSGSCLLLLSRGGEHPNTFDTFFALPWPFLRRRWI